MRATPKGIEKLGSKKTGCRNDEVKKTYVSDCKCGCFFYSFINVEILSNQALLEVEFTLLSKFYLTANGLSMV